MVKGDARHQTKPMVDVGLLFKVLQQHSNVAQNLGQYETISKAQGCNPAGLLKVHGLMNDLVDMEASCQIHQTSMRLALLQLLNQEPALNDSKYK